LPTSSIESLRSNGIHSLMPIQSETIEKLREGRDVIARAKTGSGKTLAFLIPIMEKISHQKTRKSKKPVALILEPTRELALQVARVIQTFGMPVRTCVVYGGESMTRQERALRSGCDIIVATPGRMCDFLDRNWVDLSQIRSYVVDEGDRLLDMGFEKQIEQIFNALPAEKQSILFSATLPPWAKKVAQSKMKEDQVIVDLVQNEKITVPEQIRHVAALMRRDGRYGAIENALSFAPGKKSLVFAATKVEVDEIARNISSARALHGGMVQRQRENVLGEFRRGKFDTLVATDVASRGLDINDVETVVHLRPVDFTKHPMFPEDYIHRAGRAGRAGRSGTSVFLYSDREHRMLSILEKKIGIKFEKQNFTDVEKTDKKSFRRSEGSPQRGRGNSSRGNNSSNGNSSNNRKRRFLDVEKEPRRRQEFNSFSDGDHYEKRDRSYLKDYYKKPSGNNFKSNKRPYHKNRGGGGRGKQENRRFRD